MKQGVGRVTIPQRLFAALLLLACTASPGAAQGHFPSAPELETMLRYLVEDSVVPGAVLGVLEADGSTRIVSYGSAGSAQGAMDEQRLFEIASVTKTFTATVLTDMVVRGEVALDDPVNRHLPDSVSLASRGGRAVTLEHLATHMSGLPRRGHLAEDINDPYADFTLDVLYDFADTVELRDVPGSRYRYSNSGMSLLAHVLSRAAGKPYPELLSERVLEPLGMAATTYTPTGAAIERLVMPHDDRGEIGYWTMPDVSHGLGMLFSTAADLLRYLEAQVRPADSGLARAIPLTHEIRVTTSQHAQSLGWHASVLEGDTIWWHGGATDGTTIQVAFDPGQGIGAVLLMNAGGYRDGLAVTLLAMDPAPAAWEPVRLDTAAVRRWVGSYAPEGEREAASFVRLAEDGTLTFQPRGKARARLYPTSDTTFYLLRAPWTFTFREGEDGGVRLQMDVDEREPGVERTWIGSRVTKDVPGAVAAAGGGWYRPARGPSGWAIGAFIAVVLGAILLGPVRQRLWASKY